MLVVSCTGGERGDILNQKLKDDPHILRDMAQVRRDEMDRPRRRSSAASTLARLRRLRAARG